jgi:sirohydrochlorin ferrochelatase
MAAKLSPLARDPQAVELFRQRVERKEWSRARRLALVLGLHHSSPPVIGETAPEYLTRLAGDLAKAA